VAARAFADGWPQEYAAIEYAGLQVNYGIVRCRPTLFSDCLFSIQLAVFSMDLAAVAQFRQGWQGLEDDRPTSLRAAYAYVVR
jgi:hypothetical protein